MKKILAITIVIMLAIPQQGMCLRPIVSVCSGGHGQNSVSLIRTKARQNFYVTESFENLHPLSDSERIVRLPDSMSVKNVLLICHRYGVGDIVYMEKVGRALQNKYPLASVSSGGGIDVISKAPDYWKRQGGYRAVVPIPTIEDEQNFSRLKDALPEVCYDLVVLVADTGITLNRIRKMIQLLEVDSQTAPVFGYTVYSPYLREYICSGPSIPENAKAGYNNLRDHNVAIRNVSDLANVIAAHIDPHFSLLEGVELRINREKKREVHAQLARMVTAQLGSGYPFGKDTKLIFLNPFTAEAVQKKIDWKLFADSIIMLSDELKESNAIVCLNSGLSRDREESQAITTYIRKKVPDAPFIRIENEEGVSLDEYITLVSISDLVIGIDTSSQHLAAAARVPSLTIFATSMHYESMPDTYHAPGGLSFLAENHSYLERSHDVNTDFIVQALRALVSLREGELNFFIPEHESTAYMIIEEIVRKSRELAELVHIADNREFAGRLVEVLDHALKLLELMKPEFRMLASGCNYSDNIFGNQIGHMRTMITEYSLKPKRQFVHIWLESNLFYMLELLARKGSIGVSLWPKHKPFSFEKFPPHKIAILPPAEPTFENTGYIALRAIDTAA